MAGTLTRRNFLAFDFGDRRGGDAGHWVRVHRTAMACRFEVMLASDDAADMAAAREALDAADDIESFLTVFRDDSEVTGLNRRAGREAVPASAPLFALVQRAAALHAATSGAFDITSTPLSRCWGFLRRDGRLPDDGEIASARELVGMGLVAVDEASAPSSMRVMLKPPKGFDAGGVLPLVSSLMW